MRCIFVTTLIGWLAIAVSPARAQTTPTDPTIEPERIVTKPSAALSVRALVTSPPALKGVVSWSLETVPHRGNFSVTALSPDGKVIATGGLDGTIRLWDVATGKLVRALIGHDSYVYGLAFSPGGRYLASGGSFDATARIWEVATGKPIRVLRGHPEWMGQVAWTPDGNKLVGAGGNSGYVSVWDVHAGIKRAKAALGHHIASITVHPDGKRAAAATSESAVIVFDLSNGKTERSLGEATNKYYSLAWSPSGKHLAAATAKATFLHDFETGALAAKLDGPGQVVAWSPDGSCFAVASQADSTIRICNAADAKVTHKAIGRATSLHLLPGNAQVVVADGSGIGLINVSDGKMIARHEITGTVPPLWSPGRPVLMGMATSALSLWDAGTGKLLHPLKGHTGAVTSYAWSPDSKALATAAYDKTVHVWEAGTGTVRHTLKDHTDAVLAVAWSPDGKEIASGGRDKSVLIWDAKTGALSQTLANHRGEITCLGWSPSSNFLAAGLKDGNVFVYPRSTWKQGKPLATPQLTTPSSVAWSADGKTLATGDSNGIVILWAPAKAQLLTEFPTSGSPPYISSMVFYPKGDVLACGRGNHTMDFWSLKSGKKLATVPTMAPVQQVVWNTGTALLAVSSHDRTCRFFDPLTGRFRGALLADADQMIAVSAEGHYRAEGPALERLVVVVQTERGQETLTPAEFGEKHKWKNSPTLARVTGK